MISAFIGIFIVAVIFIGVFIQQNRKLPTADIEIEENFVEFENDKIGNDSISGLDNSYLVLDFNGKNIQITSSGSLFSLEKANNIKNINKQLEKARNGFYNFLYFEDSAPLFSNEKVGSDIYRKMFAKNSHFDVRKPIVSGYKFDALPQERLADIGQTKKEVLGTIYFDYGYANLPKNTVIESQKITFGKIDFNKTRYTETITALKSLLSEIPHTFISTMVLYVDGHTDRVSPHDFNQTLSEARAECIKEILIKDFGIDKKNIVTKGYSWDRLAINTMEECAENRRVELSVVFFN